MLVVLARNWWMLVLRGLVAVVFGVLALLWPGIAIDALVILFGAYALVDGTFSIATAIVGPRGGRPWWALLIEGLLGIAAGLITFFYPGITALILLYFIAFWAILTGVMEIIAAVQLRKEIKNEWLLGISGALSVIFGLLLIAFPGAGALSVIWIIAIYAIIFGVMMIALGFRVRSAAQEAGNVNRET